MDNLELKTIKDHLKENQTLIIGATRYENNRYYNSLLNINYVDSILINNNTQFSFLYYIKNISAVLIFRSLFLLPHTVS